MMLENMLIKISPEDVKIENGIMIPNQFPDKVNIFSCNGLQHITSLENCPYEVDRFDCNYTNITSLKGAPKIVNGVFDCIHTKIISLDYAPLKCTTFRCSKNSILHLQGIGRSYLKECETIVLPDTIKSNILGLCRVKNLHTFYIYDKYVNYIRFGELFEALQIVKKYLNTDGSDCAEELMQNGFNDYAKF
jgi:hypothetical protein